MIDMAPQLFQKNNIGEYMAKLANPYTPGAGYTPPHLAGRDQEIAKFQKLLNQEIILKNPIFTGLRGVGKTVLLSEVEPIAKESNWIWVGKELAESVFVSEDSMAMRLLADLSFFTSVLSYTHKENIIGMKASVTICSKRRIPKATKKVLKKQITSAIRPNPRSFS